MKIGVDLDEVLADFLSALIKYHNSVYRTSLIREDFHSYDFWKVWGGTRDQAIQKVYDFYKTDYFKSIDPVFGAQNAIKLLRQKNELFIITSRQKIVYEVTINWINEFFPNSFSDVYFADYYSNTSNLISKKNLCNNLGIDIFIDDVPKYILECTDSKIKALLFTAPWNKKFVLPENVYRVDSWNNIVDFFHNHFLD